MAVVPDRRRYGPDLIPTRYTGRVGANVVIQKNNPVVAFEGLLYPVGALSTTNAPNAVTVGIATETVDNTGGAAGALRCNVVAGCFAFDSLAAADLVTEANQFQEIYWGDVDSVALTSDTNTRTKAGRLMHIGERGELFVLVGLFVG